MRPAILLLGSATISSANIIFSHPPLACDNTSPKIYHGCLRGQECLEDGTCMPVDEIRYPLSFRTVPPELRPRDGVSTDGRCGPDFDNTTCDPNSSAYTGGCCSQYGYCGNTVDHCGAGCISGCSDATPVSSTASSAPSSSPVAPRSDGRCGNSFGGATCDANGAFGGCCSQYGFCGNTPDHCLVANNCQSGCTGGTATQTGSQPATTSSEPVIAPIGGGSGQGGDTKDGTCGAANGNTVCGHWPNGNCCSVYGFCGNTDAHCGAGCQSGNCLGPPAVPVPGPSPAPVASNPGSFKVVGEAGVAVMHAALMPNGRVMFLDKLQNYSQLRTADGYYAMSAEYDPVTNTVAPLSYSTNAFCAGGTFLADGRVISLGGNAPLTWLDPNIGDGFTAIRYLQRSSTDAGLDGQNWSEPGSKLSSARWYPSAQTLPDGSVFVASGSLNGLDPTVLANNNPTYEILNPDGISQGNAIAMELLNKNQPYYMYPFIHLMSDGNLFVFVSKSSQIFDVQSNAVVQELPGLPGDYRTYPNTGGSVLLPLSSANNWAPDIVICGGGSYQDITSPTDPSCGRIQPLSTNPSWEMDSMPEGRGMVEGTLLPDGTVVWLNGGNRGAQGFGLMADPTLEALLYDPAQPLGQRWTTLASSSIPRLYHSCALLMLDGTMMVAGSDPVEMPVLTADATNPYITEYRVEQYTPPYLQGDNASKRPTNVKLSSLTVSSNGATFPLSFECPTGAQKLKVVLYHGGFVTHSLHMGHRMVDLDVVNWTPGATQQNVVVTGPPNNNVAPPGPYVIYVLVDGIPSVGQFVTVPT